MKWIGARLLGVANGRNAVLASLICFLSLSIPAVGQSKALFYMIDTPNSVKSFTDHADKVDILVPTWYRVDGDGLMWGGPNPAVLQVAAQHHVAVMPIVANMQQIELHKLLTTPAAHKALIDAMVAQCKTNAYSGFQFDFENVLWADRDLLTDLVAEAAAALHKENLQLTIATVPNGPGAAGKSGYARWIYANWRGAYDLQALAKSVDLICLMTYDQNTRWTAPGPVAGYPWTVEQLEYALRFVPKGKLSLGIPIYGYHWFAGEPGKDDKPNPTAEYVGQSEIDQYVASYHPRIEWDAIDRVAWFYFYPDDTRDWVFYTDKRGFQERLNLVHEHHLEGFCSWVLGAEDPAIWEVLPSHR